MSSWNPSVAMSPNDRVRTAAIDLLVERGPAAVGPLVEQLGDDSWVVRRRLVAALAAFGDAATPALSELIAVRRPSEAAIAAGMDALTASVGTPDDALFDLLRSDNPAVICDGAQVLGRRRVQRAVPALQALMTHPDDNVAVAAVEALGRIGGERALGAIIEAPETDNFFRIFPRIDVLGLSGDFRAVPLLENLLAEPLYEAAAARALGHIGGSRAISALVGKLAQTTDPGLTGPLTTALAQLATGPAEGASVFDAVRKAGRPLLSSLRPLLTSREESERVGAATLIGALGIADAACALLPLLDAPGLLAQTAAGALLALGTEGEGVISKVLREGPSARRVVTLPVVNQRRYAGDVVETLSDPDPTVRALACAALARLGDPAHVRDAFALLRDPDAKVAQAALSAVQSLGGTETERLVLEAARSSDPRLQRVALRIVGYFGYPSALDVVLTATMSPDTRLRDAAVQALPFIGGERAVKRLLELGVDHNPQLRASAMRAFAHLLDPAPDVMTVLRGGLGDTDAWVRYFSAQSLGRIIDAGAEQPLLALVRDPAGQVRAAAIEALATLGSEAAQKALISAAQSDDPDEERAALVALGIGAQPSALPVLNRALESPVASTRLVALSALANFVEAQWLPSALRAAGDSDEGVRIAAVALLGKGNSVQATLALVDLLADKRVKKQVMAALSTPSETRLRGICDALQSVELETAVELVRALREMPNDAGWRALLGVMSNGGSPARRAAARTLALSGKEDARAVLRRAAVSDPEPDIRKLSEQAAGLR